MFFFIFLCFCFPQNVVRCPWREWRGRNVVRQLDFVFSVPPHEHAPFQSACRTYQWWLSRFTGGCPLSPRRHSRRERGYSGSFWKEIPSLGGRCSTSSGDHGACPQREKTSTKIENFRSIWTQSWGTIGTAAEGKFAAPPCLNAEANEAFFCKPLSSGKTRVVCCLQLLNHDRTENSAERFIS